MKFLLLMLLIFNNLYSYEYNIERNRNINEIELKKILELNKSIHYFYGDINKILKKLKKLKIDYKNKNNIYIFNNDINKYIDVVNKISIYGIKFKFVNMNIDYEYIYTDEFIIINNIKIIYKKNSIILYNNIKNKLNIR